MYGSFRFYTNTLKHEEINNSVLQLFELSNPCSLLVWITYTIPSLTGRAISCSRIGDSILTQKEKILFFRRNLSTNERLGRRYFRDSHWSNMPHGVG